MSERGQATVELIGALPALILCGMVALQLTLAGYCLLLADESAGAGARALAADADGERAAREALPGWARAGARLEVEGGRVSVSLSPPAPIEAIGRALSVGSTAWARPADGAGS